MNDGGSRGDQEALARGPSRREFCAKHLRRRYELEIVVFCQKPALMKGEQIMAVPKLIKSMPLPLQRFFGAMRNDEQMLFGMDIVPDGK